MATGPPPDGADPAVPLPEGSDERGPGDSQPLERRFNAAIIGVYIEAESLGYRSHRPIEHVRAAGGLAIAREILAADTVHDGLAELFLLGRLDLAVEYQVLLPEYRALFSEDELRTAQLRVGLARRSGGKSRAAIARPLGDLHRGLPE